MIPKSVTPSRIVDNFQEIELDDEDVKAIEKMTEKGYERFNVPYLCSTYFPAFSFASPPHSLSFYSIERYMLGVWKIVLMSEIDKPRWNVEIFGEEGEKPATHKIVLA